MKKYRVKVDNEWELNAVDENHAIEKIVEGLLSFDDLSFVANENMENEMKDNMIKTRQEFMDFYRSDEHLNQLSVEDRLEIFVNILVGESDITQELIHEVCSNYGVECPCCKK